MYTVGIDFEFYNSHEKQMKLVAAVLDYPDKGIFKFNLYSEQDVESLKRHLNEIKENKHILLAYAAIAEGRAISSLGLEPLDFLCIDLYAEFIMACNSNNDLAYGSYIHKTGSICYSIPVDPNALEDGQDHTETPKNLINCAYKMLGIRLDAEEKETMRCMILSKNDSIIQEHMEEILDYCASDTKYLRDIHSSICTVLKKLGLRKFEEDQLKRGRYALAVSKSEELGIPINLELLQKVIDKTEDILKVHEDEVNKFFPYFVPELVRPPKTFKNGKLFHYKPVPKHKDGKAYQNYVESLNIPNFPKTETGKYKSDKDTLETWGYWGGLESLWKYNKMESSLKWFNKENGNGFFERMGSDEVVRPYYGIFGTQTGRNAPKAKTFPLAMSSWLRAIIRPNKDSVIIGCDFSQQEVYVAAILSGDKALLEAYNSGDVYLAFAKQAGLVPSSATKATHKEERTLCKSTVLG